MNKIILCDTLVMSVCQIQMLEFRKLPPDSRRHHYTEVILMDVQMMYNGNHLLTILW